MSGQTTARRTSGQRGIITKGPVRRPDAPRRSGSAGVCNFGADPVIPAEAGQEERLAVEPLDLGERHASVTPCSVCQCEPKVRILAEGAPALHIAPEDFQPPFRVARDDPCCRTVSPLPTRLMRTWRSPEASPDPRARRWCSPARSRTREPPVPMKRKRGRAGKARPVCKACHDLSVEAQSGKRKRKLYPFARPRQLQSSTHARATALPAAAHRYTFSGTNPPLCR